MFISHRGNLEGRIAERENQPEYIDEAIAAGYKVEVDLWVDNKRVYLGHDDGQYNITLDWLLQRKEDLLVHTKNKDALNFSLVNSLHCFWHTDEDYVMTNCGYVVGYPGKLSVGDKFILAVPERHWQNVMDCKPFITFGVLSDYVKTLNTR